MTPSASLRASLTEASWRYHDHVERAATYLQGRGLWGESLLATYRLGVVVDPAPGHESFVGRLAIPYLTPSGVVNMRFRSLDDSLPKYLGLPGADLNMFGVMALHQPSSLVLVCEGELDTIAANYAGLAAVGIPGVRAWKAHYGRLLQDYERVVVVADGDDAGKGLADVVHKAVESAEIRLMPDGHDVNSFILERGDEAFYEWIAT